MPEIIWAISTLVVLTWCVHAIICHNKTFKHGMTIVKCLEDRVKHLEDARSAEIKQKIEDWKTSKGL